MTPSASHRMYFLLARPAIVLHDMWFKTSHYSPAPAVKLMRRGGFDRYMLSDDNYSHTVNTIKSTIAECTTFQLRVVMRY